MLYIFDKDGTLVTKRGGGDPPIPNSIHEQQARPGVIGRCGELRAQGHTLAIASNQGGVAWGFISLENAEDIMKHAAGLIGAEEWAMCPHHPEAPSPLLGRECLCRKPQPGMLLAIIARLGFDRTHTIYVGDMDTDRQAAEAAGVRFVWAADFFAPAGSQSSDPNADCGPL